VLGSANADAVRRVILRKHTYRFGMVVGVQPEKAGPLLFDAPAGTPQRLIWLPATDPAIPNRPAPTPPRLVIDWKSYPAGADKFTP
jgi:hypothetical protein